MDRDRSRGTGNRHRAKQELNHLTREMGRMPKRGISANHLLNFTLPEHQRGHAPTTRKKHQVTHTQMEYLHANYRFVVAPLPDRADVTCFDVDTLTEWDNVEEVLLWCDESDPATCPICLDRLHAPKITHCGHVFCWPCILRYLSMTDKYWRRCPMCFDSVQKGHLRSVRLETVQLPPQIGSVVTFQRLERTKGSLSPYIRDLPQGALARRRTGQLPRVEDVDAKYSRILESSKDYLVNIATKELKDLETLEAEWRSSGDVDMLPFVEEAMKATSQRLAAFESMPEDTGRHRKHLSSSDTTESAETSDTYSFYQIDNGTCVVLHPLNVKCLRNELELQAAVDVAKAEAELDSATQLEQAWQGDASTSSPPIALPGTTELPPIVRGRIVDIEHNVMDDDMQRRYRFLSHLPRFCDYYLCELDLTDQLSPATIEAFHLKKREKQRRAKRRAELRAQKEEATPKDRFSLDTGDVYWPAPAEAWSGDSADVDNIALQELLMSDAAASPPPQPSSTSDYAEALRASDEPRPASFPPLSSSPPPIETATSSPSMWGSDLQGFRAALTTAPASSGKSKKKGPMKKGAMLFSTNQRRSYR